jgi:aspartyl-tRNA(Asn)/glutamyl-tRNA(Gln) amidotransferase subunit B
MRQIGLLESGGVVEQVTLTFNAASGAVTPLRSKEDAHDYRYFPDPDLPPVVLDAAWLAARDAELPELPAERQARFRETLGLSDYNVTVLTQEPVIADYFEAIVAAGAEAKTAANWVLGEVLAAFNEQGVFVVAPARIAELTLMVGEGVVSLQAAKRIYAELLAGDAAPRAVAERLGLLQVRDAGALTDWVDEVVVAHPDEVARYRGGEAKLIGFFVGQVMKRSGGKADPKGIQPILRARLDQ